MLHLDLAQLSPAARRALDPAAPRPVRDLGSRGILPGLAAAELVTVVVGLSTDADDPALRQVACATLAQLPKPVLSAALSADLQAVVIDRLARQLHAESEVVAALLKMPRLSEETLIQLAHSADEEGGEVIATNEALLLQMPRGIEALYLNKRVRMSTAQRLVELAIRNRLTLDIAGFEQLVQALASGPVNDVQVEAEACNDETCSALDALAVATEQELGEAQGVVELDEKGQETVAARVKPLYAMLGELSIAQKIRRALIGTRPERMLLVRERNRLVATAAASSPMLNESEAAQIAASRTVIDDVLRIIALNKDLVRNYQVKLNLVSNPLTPLTFSARLIPHLRANDIRSLTRSKNIPAAVQAAARQQLRRRS